MSEKIKPALTAKEWEVGEVRRGGRVVAAAWKGGDFFVNAEDEHGFEIPANLYSTRHAVAALALYGQPFGFTREDVRLLREEVEDFLHRPRPRIASAQILESLADRIEALLPEKK